jgi:hypothetical protein
LAAAWSVCELAASAELGSAASPTRPAMIKTVNTYFVADEAAHASEQDPRSLLPGRSAPASA